MSFLRKLFGTTSQVESYEKIPNSQIRKSKYCDKKEFFWGVEGIPWGSPIEEVLNEIKIKYGAIKDSQEDEDGITTIHMLDGYFGTQGVDYWRLQFGYNMQTRCQEFFLCIITLVQPQELTLKAKFEEVYRVIEKKYGPPDLPSDHSAYWFYKENDKSIAHHGCIIFPSQKVGIVFRNDLLNQKYN